MVKLHLAVIAMALMARYIYLSVSASTAATTATSADACEQLDANISQVPVHHHHPLTAIRVIPSGAFAPTRWVSTARRTSTSSQKRVEPMSMCGILAIVDSKVRMVAVVAVVAVVVRVVVRVAVWVAVASR